MVTTGHRSYILTGGTGFLGSLLGVELLRRGCTVFFLGRRKDSHNYEARQRGILEDIDAGVPLERASFFEIDFESEALGLKSYELEVMKNADGFFHFAADLSFRSAHKNRVRKANLHVLSNVLLLAESLETTFFFVSTAYVHGKQKLGALIPEALLPRPAHFHNAYEESKYDAEFAVKKWSDANHLRYAILRPSIVVDRTGRTSTPLGFSSILIGIEKMKQRYPRLMSGSLFPFLVPFPYSSRARLNLVPADWVIYAVITIAEKNTVNGQIFNLTNPESIPAKRVIVHAFEQGSGVKLFAFSAPAWFVQFAIFLFYCLGGIFPPLRILSERLWLYRFCLTEANVYAMDHTNELLSASEGPRPTLTNDELRAVAAHFIPHYHKKVKEIRVG